VTAARKAVTRLAIAALVAGLAIALVVHGEDGASPATTAEARAPERADLPPPPRVTETRMPPRLLEVKQDAYGEAVARRSDTPGHDAFRRMSRQFVRYNLEAAEEQAAAEGLTVAEVEELTYFGQVVQHTQRWGEVEAILGRAPTEEEMERASRLMHELDAQFTERMRAAVAAGAAEAERRPLIADLQQRYEREYLAITGMTPDQLDDLLVADLLR
jgi:hypothetical protein